MKRLVLCALLIATVAIAEEWPKIYDSQSKGWMSWEKLEQEMSDSQVVYVGELHDHVWGHKIELMLLEKLFSKNANVAIALEMFERDTQNIIDGYLSEEITESFFLKNSRPWGNYAADYRPLIEFSRLYHLSVLAMNVPRRYASFVAKDKEPALATMPDAEKSYMATEIKALKGKYRDKFYEVMGGHVPPALVERYYRSQCLKDDTMAESIVSFLKGKPNTTVISYTGAFHSDESLGLVEKVNALMPNTKSTVISIVPVDSAKFNPHEHSHKGDFILFAPANKTSSRSSIAQQILSKLRK
ncbi:ChaN family lipoprotein [Candidatus Uabimicrobium sp. HlEnr_7]|uniref:ChaN family lipoprotein n=1 Tax=Candidatus Uabimicrobium helgolandensis TaxID=3095367 RepID=UPI003558008B